MQRTGSPSRRAVARHVMPSRRAVARRVVLSRRAVASKTLRAVSRWHPRWVQFSPLNRKRTIEMEGILDALDLSHLLQALKANTL